MNYPTLEYLGDSALLLRLGESVDEALNVRVHALSKQIRAAGWPELADVVPTYASVTVFLDPMPAERWAALSAELLCLAQATIVDEATSPRIVVSGS